MSALADLATRVEAEEPNYDLWIHAGSEISEAGRPWDRFCELCLVGAWRDAAAMLMPAGWLVDISEWPSCSYDTFECRLVREADYDARANISKTEVLASAKRGPHAEARARLAAALRAHDTAGAEGRED